MRGKGCLTVLAGTVTAWIVLAVGGPIAGIPLTSGFEGLGQGITHIVLAVACGILAVFGGTFVTSQRSHHPAVIIGAVVIGVVAVVAIVWWAPSLAITYLASTRAAVIAIVAVAIATAIGVAFSSVKGGPINRRRLTALGIAIPLLFIAGASRTIGANYLFDRGRLSEIERSWEQSNGGETWAPPGAHSHATQASFGFGGNYLSFTPDGSAVSFDETPAKPSASTTMCSYPDCIERTSPAGHSMWFRSDSMGRPLGGETQVVLGHTVVNIWFTVGNELQNAALTNSDLAHRGQMVDGLRRTTLKSLMQITWPDLIGP